MIVPPDITDQIQVQAQDLDKKLSLAYRMDETKAVQHLIQELDKYNISEESFNQIQQYAKELVTNIRNTRLKQGGLDAFLYEYDLSAKEGIALMCLSEALLRIPDSNTRDRLIKDKILSANWEQHIGNSHSWFVNASTLGLILTGKVLSLNNLSSSSLLDALKKLVNRIGEPLIRQAITQAMKILGKQFVMGETIEEALHRAKKNESLGYRYSYDMLGEAAKTKADAQFYFSAYQDAIEKVGKVAKGLGPLRSPGVSIKLSALHPRFEWVNRERLRFELLPELKKLALLAKEMDIGFTIDAEEADRLQLTLLLFKELAMDKELSHWQGLGLAVQSYQKRGIYVIDWLKNLAIKSNRTLMVRLVKGAYWDSEIKWSQEKGLKGYPVFTRKSSTDVSFLACAMKMIEAGPVFYSQFATHNAYSVAFIKEKMDELQNKSGEKIPFEFQCLHGMGESLYDKIVGEQNLNIPCRIYAPVGGHEHLLAYLVRRLLENCANTSFVNRIIDDELPIEDLVQNPIEKTKKLTSIPHPKIPLPRDIFGDERPNSSGIDLTNPEEIDPILKEIKGYFPTIFSERIHETTVSELDKIFDTCSSAFLSWEKVSTEQRMIYLENMATLLEANRAYIMALLIREGGKTVQDALSELREAIDFCWYYREQIKKHFQPNILQGPTGEFNQLQLVGRGIIVCISPWNFPLAIFLGQILASLAAGNAVIAKPASQTPLVAEFAVKLLHDAGFPKEIVHCVVGSGSTIGARLIEDPRTKGVMLTGSTETAHHINVSLAKRRGPIVPFIAETGGQNALIADSSALPEQVVSDILTSSFNSAGQRCSALRVLFVQEEVADKIIKMLVGAMQELKIGDPFDLSTDVGPVIDEGSRRALEKHVEGMQLDGKLLCQLELKNLPKLPRGVFFAPRLYELASIEQLKQEVFGPILHVVRFSMNNIDHILQLINQTGYGLTLGIHSRINDTVDYIASRLRVGNIYVNRNMIGAVVGVQPFGGEGLSGTGPKAGGPHLLPRLATERSISVNIAAMGGNTALLSLSEEI